MRILAISDVHGAHNKLMAVLGGDDGADAADIVVFLGDVVGTSSAFEADISHCVRLLKRHADVAVLGNHGARHADTYPYPARQFEPGGNDERSVSDDVREWLSVRPKRYQFAVSLGAKDDYARKLVHAAHADPFAPDGNYVGYPAENYLYKREWITASGPLNGGLMLMGHTHRQAALCVDKFPQRSGLIVNPGSVAQGEYAVIDTSRGLSEDAVDLCELDINPPA